MSYDLPISNEIIKQAKLLVERLERVSVDSIWARRASGHRGALLKWIEKYEALSAEAGQPHQFSSEEIQQLSKVLDACYTVMERAAKERLR